MYQYLRGGTKVTGPSIRLAEVLAQNWGNLSFGVKELEQRDGESIAMAYTWDLETNVTRNHSEGHRRQGCCGVRKDFAGNNTGPLKDGIAHALKSFKEQNRITQEVVEEKFGYNAESFTEYD